MMNDTDFLSIMNRGPAWASINLARATGLTVEQARKTLRRLQRKGLVEARGQTWGRVDPGRQRDSK